MLPDELIEVLTDELTDELIEVFAKCTSRFCSWPIADFVNVTHSVRSRGNYAAPAQPKGPYLIHAQPLLVFSKELRCTDLVEHFPDRVIHVMRVCQK